MDTISIRYKSGLFLETEVIFLDVLNIFLRMLFSKSSKSDSLFYSTEDMKEFIFKTVRDLLDLIGCSEL